ncbi:MAG TPA: ELWxxDGT repeat protein [Thermoanaerobaculia bacterium]|jgi:ELWxxDGT repeat protein|nr:ELWxxDGT repeat protein [Thermoanaerobaculia bacterium]
MRPRQIAEALLSLVLAAGPVRAAEVPRLLADINRTPSPPAGLFVAEPSGFFSLGGRTLFSTKGFGDEGILWSTDGSASGTRMVSSTICPYPCQGITSLGAWHGVALLKVAMGSAESSPDGVLWRTDGTTAGTFPLAGPFPFDPFRTVTTIYPVGDRFFFFVACSDGCTLFRSDGTRAGTAPFVAAGFTSSFLDPHSFAVWRDRLVFIAISEEPQGLWSTDGTPEGTVRLADVQEAEDVPAPVVPASSQLFFGSGDRGEDLWVTDGTPGGARRLADLDPAPCFPPPEHFCAEPDINSLTAIGDGVLFVTVRTGHGEEVWRSDGTQSGTRPVIELPPPQIWGVPERLPGDRWLFAASPTGDGGTLALWTADDDFSHAAPLTGCDGGACPAFEGFLSPTLPHLFVGRDDAHGGEVWITDGTGAGTHLLADICPGPCSGSHSQFVKTVLGSAAGKSWFLAFPRDGGSDSTDDELWVTDGTPGGTHRVAGPVTSGLGFLGDLAFFGLGGQDRNASELWATDGSPAGTRQVTVLQRLAPGSYPEFLPRDGGSVLLKVYDGTHSALWRSDGTPEGTIFLVELRGGRSFAGTGFTTVGDLQFFTVVHGDRVEIWRSDGTAAGTLRVSQMGSGIEPSLLTSWRGRLLFRTAGGRTCAFWSSDGSPGGTREILSQLRALCPAAIQPLGARFLFVADVGHGLRTVPQIFLSDGMATGTRQISQIRYPRPSLEGESPVTVGGITFFRIFRPNASDSEIWRTDGTGPGTYLAFNLAQPADLFGFRGFLYFTASPANDFTRVLYRVSASGGEPVPLAGVGMGFVAPALPVFTPVGDRLFFIASDADSGAELWVTDGTPAGTRRVRDIHPGPASSQPDSLVAAGNRLFFAAEDGEHGRELWESDGTEAGTRLAWDLNPGGFSSNPVNLALSGNFLFFSADDGETGVEPWVLRLEP